MSIHFIRKGVDKRFVDAVVVSERYCSSNECDLKIDNHICIKKNTGLIHHDDQVVNSRFIIYSSPDWYIQNTKNWLDEYLIRIINFACCEGYKSLAVPVDISTEKQVSIAEIYKILTEWIPSDFRAYIIVEKNQSFLDGNKQKVLEKYIEDKYKINAFASNKLISPFIHETKNSLGTINQFDDNNKGHISTDDDDDYLNDVIIILKRNSGKKDRREIAQKLELEEYISIKEEGFCETLLRIIEEKEVDPVECYKRANVNRRTFSKIRTNRNYHPSKKTVFAFALSLKLNYEETEYLLKSAGYTFTNSSILDIIVEYHILNEIYDIFEVNNALFEFDQPLLGG